MAASHVTKIDQGYRCWVLDPRGTARGGRMIMAIESQNQVCTWEYVATGLLQHLQMLLRPRWSGLRALRGVLSPPELMLASARSLRRTQDGWNEGLQQR
jgi:hypothetical protein